MPQQASQVCKDFVKSKESCRLQVYEDLNGNPTIGWGHKLTQAEIRAGVYEDGITQQEADTIFDSDCRPFEDQVNALGLTLTQGQFDCLFDFTFNLGLRATKMMLAHGLDDVPNQLTLWVNAGGVSQPGLVTRRAQDVAWWNS